MDIEDDEIVIIPPSSPYDPNFPTVDNTVYDPNFPTGCILDKRNQLEVGLSRSAAVWKPNNELNYNCLLRCIKEFMKYNNMSDRLIYNQPFQMERAL